MMEVGYTSGDKQYVEVIIDTAVSGLDRPFHYQVPGDMQGEVEIGSLVLVPFTNRLTLGYVVGFPSHPHVSTVKDIYRVLDEPPLFDFDGQRLYRWIASHYMCSLSQAFRLAMPPGRSRKVRQFLSLEVSPEDALRRAGGQKALRDVIEVLAASGGEIEIAAVKKHLGGSGVPSAVRSGEAAEIINRRFVLTRPSATPRLRKVARLTDEARAPGRLDDLPGRQRDIAVHLLAGGCAELQSDLLRLTGASHSSLASLADKGLVEITSQEVQRLPRLTGGLEEHKRHTPNTHQREAIERVCEAIGDGRHRVFLLDGVTGSGKTEVYLRSIEQVLNLGKSAIVLVPEISLTPQTLERFEHRFPGEVAVLHSRLGPGERYDQWRGVREGRYRVVVGARSALFAPVSDLGLIAIDEEHEPSYKSDIAPRYHARDVAEVRARMAGAPLILGSATPSFETLQRARAGRYEHLDLPRRIDDRPMPSVEVVDMRSVGGAGVLPLLSPVLLDALSRTVEADDQAILFLNRRGFSNYLQCHACGHILGCDDCEVSLCYHASGNVLRCHHCDRRWNVPPRCPECGGGPLKGFGAGTQRVEEELNAQLPGVSMIRMDTDTTRGKDAHWRLLGSFRAGEAQVLIGTQMIAKGLDIPGVTLVGVINADTALALPDFRASERTYQLLTQVSGRAGRGLRPGRVVIQTFNPEHPAIRALSGKMAPFIESELGTRRSASYPPFVSLVNVLISSPEVSAASRSSDRMKKILESDLSGTGTVLLGPAPAPLSRLRGSYRWHIMLKSGDLDAVSERVRRAVGRFHEEARKVPAGRDVKISLDVDPVSLL